VTTSNTPVTTASAAAGALPRVAWFVGLAGHLVMLVWYAATGLVAPNWAVAVLLAIWIGFSLVALRLYRRWPIWMLAVPLAEAAIWYALVSAGDVWLGWTA
jgi:hypothetical protein